MPTPRYCSRRYMGARRRKNNVETAVHTRGDSLLEEDLAETEWKLTTDWDEYLDRLLWLDPERYTVFMAVRGGQGKNLTLGAVEKRKALGFDKADTLLDGQSRAFAGIRAGGGYCCQDYSAGEGAISHHEMLNNQQVSLASRMAGAGNSASIRPGSREYAKNRNGFNIVVEDVIDGELVDSVAFDLDVETVSASR